MNKRWIAILAGVLGFFIVLGVGMLAGGTLAYLTMRARPVQAALALQGSAPDPNTGLLIANVDAEGPAAQSGVVRGDILISMNDQTLNTLQDLQSLLTQAKPGDTASLAILHGDETRSLAVTLGDNGGTAYLGIVPCLMGPQGMGGIQPNFNGGTLNSTPGAQITDVIQGGPADKAGLQAGDVILAVDGQEINADHLLADLIQNHQPNDTVQLSIQKSGNSTASDIDVTLGENPDTPGKAYLGVYYASRYNQDGNMPFFQNPGNGGNGQNLPFGHPPLGQTLPSLPDGVNQAVMIGDVLSGTPAAEAGLQINDVITAVDGTTVADAQALVDAIASHKPGDRVALTVYRSGHTAALTIDVTLGENPNQPGSAYMGVSIRDVSTGLPENHPPIAPLPTPDNNGGTIPNLPGGGDA